MIASTQTQQLAQRINSRVYWLCIYSAAVAIFTINRWPMHQVFSSGFAKALALLVALPVSWLLWLASTKRLSFSTLTLLYALLVAAIGIFLEYFTYQISPQNPTSFLFYGSILALGVSVFTSAYIGKLPAIRNNRQGKYVTTILSCLLFGLLMLPIIKQSATTNLLADLPTVIPVPANQLHVLDTFKLYNEINAMRIQQKLAPLSFNYQLETAAKMVANANADTVTNAKVEEIVKQQGYNFSAIGELTSSFANTATEKDIVKELYTKSNLQQLFSSNTYSDIGIAAIAKSDTNDVYIIVGSQKSQPQQTKIIYQTANPAPDNNNPSYFTGVELFAAVNQARIGHGVNPLGQRNELCTVASIRLNQQLDLGKLDNHAGFNGVLATYKDQLSQYSHIAENLAEGYATAQDTVNAWEGSPGHAVLLKDGSYVWGCTAANHGFSVLIAAY